MHAISTAVYSPNELVALQAKRLDNRLQNSLANNSRSGATLDQKVPTLYRYVACRRSIRLDRVGSSAMAASSGLGFPVEVPLAVRALTGGSMPSTPPEYLLVGQT